MFPVSDVIPPRRTPVATVILVALTAAGFAYELGLPDGHLQALVNAHGVIPAEFNWRSTVTSLFLHSGWLHICTNLLYLWIFGDNVEGVFGRTGFAFCYLACAAAAAATQVVVHPSSRIPMIGASGAVAGVMGAYLVLYPRSRVLTAVLFVPTWDLVEVPAVFFLGIWFLLQLVNGAGSIGAHTADGALALWAHVAGLLTGALCGVYSRFVAASLRRYWD